MTENELAIVVNQIQGIMDCSDMINLSYITKNKQLMKIHKNRLCCLMKLNQTTQFKLMDKYNQVIQIKEEFTRLDDDIDSALVNILDTWIKWDTVAIELYKSESGHWWDYLRKLHERDLKLAQECVRKCKVTLPVAKTTKKI